MKDEGRRGKGRKISVKCLSAPRISHPTCFPTYDRCILLPKALDLLCKLRCASPLREQKSLRVVFRRHIFRFFQFRVFRFQIIGKSFAKHEFVARALVRQALYIQHYNIACQLANCNNTIRISFLERGRRFKSDRRERALIISPHTTSSAPTAWICFFQGYAQTSRRAPQRGAHLRETDL